MNGTHYKTIASIMPAKKHSNTSTKYIQPTFSFLYKSCSSFTWGFCLRILNCRTSFNLHIFFNFLLCGPPSDHNLNAAAFKTHSFSWSLFITWHGRKKKIKSLRKWWKVEVKKKMDVLKGKEWMRSTYTWYLDQPQDTKN